ncbi:RNA polymerase subunit sigma-70, partial [Streptococcus suis]
LGAGQSWVKISLYRGRKQLRKALEEIGYDYEDF